MNRIESTTRKLFAMLAVAFLFLATVGIPVGTHWCGGKVYKVNLYSLAESCMPVSIPSDEVAIGHEACCKDQLDLLAAKDLDNDGAPQIAKAPVQPELVLESVPAPAWLTASHMDLPVRIHSPPPKVRDLVVEFRTLLI